MKKYQYFIFFILVCLISGGVYLYLNRQTPNSNLMITFKEIKKVETGTKIDPIDLIESTSSSQVLYPKIDTSTPGKKKLLFIAVGKSGYQKEFMTEIEVIDPTPPELILSKDEVVITVGEKFDAKSYIQKAYDNFDGELHVDISKNFDANVVGNYVLTYKVEDSSGNISEKTLSLIVKEKVVQPDLEKGKQNQSNSNEKSNEAIPPIQQPKQTLPEQSYNGQSTWFFEDGYSAASAQSSCETAGINTGGRWSCSVIYNDLGIHIGYRLNILY